MHVAEAFLDALARGFVGEAAGRLAAGVTIDDPREGKVAGVEPVQRWLVAAHEWLVGLSARVEPIRTTVSGREAAVEVLVRVRVEGEERQLPVAIAAEVDDRDLLRAIRIYHSFWTVDRAHRPRGRVLPARLDVALAPPIDAYQRALARGDVEGVLACYERGATIREPAGEPWVHRGPRGLRRFYGAAFCYGGVPLEHANVIDDGVACALEYTVVRWGRTDLPPQGGIVVYERGRSGLIRATRIYDDVDPPRE